MKRNTLSYIIAGLFLLTSCHDLDLNPLDQGASGNWYSSQVELEMAVNDMYRIVFWPADGHRTSDWSDDFTNRNVLTPFENGTFGPETVVAVNGNIESGNPSKKLWENQYKVIARATAVILKAERALENGVPAETVDRLVAEAHFHRAAAYSKLVIKFGDVPFVDKEIDIETALTMGRTDKQTILKFAYDEFDEAARVLPASYTGEQRATKGAALAMKARLALCMSDWATAAASAKAVIDLGVYTLHKDYSELFLIDANKSSEPVFYIPRALGYGNIYMHNADWVKDILTRNAGGYISFTPSWDLFASYLCTDGLPVDESPLFDPTDPFKNRDPRCSMTIVPFGTEWLGYEYNPHPQAKQVKNSAGTMVSNNDTRSVAQYASFNGLAWKKGVDITWRDNGFTAAPDMMIMRYADVLLMYAEAKIELNEIDQSVLDAMNEVRARAYGVSKDETSAYPAFTSKVQAALRTQLRMERRMEFAKENLRFQDLIRWRYSEIVMKRNNYGLLNCHQNTANQAIVAENWFWPIAPDIDENGLPDFTRMEATGKILRLSERNWDDRMYLWPIPPEEIQINDNMTQNTGY